MCIRDRDVISAYFKQVNDAGGVNGRKLELIAMDDGYETDRAVANTKALINDKKVFAMVASYGSVSYTHLDVYKRQTLTRTKQSP